MFVDEKGQVKMICVNLLVFLYILQVSTSDWIADWMSPVQEQFEETSQSRKNGPSFSLKQFEDEYEKMAPVYRDPEAVASRPRDEQSTVGLKVKLEYTLENAKNLAETLRTQILELSAKEAMLKDAIVNGRSGISTVTVSTEDQRARSYMIREGVWTLCTGIIQTPSAVASTNLFNGLFSIPRCIGQEIPTTQDPCVFNSVIKYETIPTQRRLLYTEDDYLCLKSSFNTTLEQYVSVPRRLINVTCEHGIIRSLEENRQQCGIRVLSEYSYYPHRSSSLPLEYCAEADGACKLIVAWHVSNATVENFEFLRDEPTFKKYFMTSFSRLMLSM